MDEVKQALEAGKTVVYMSDQGLPNVADPGHALLEMAYDLHARVSVIPGPSSISTALAACPFIRGPYIYTGLLPRESPGRRRMLKKLSAGGFPLVILDTPYRLPALFKDCISVFGPARPAFLALDISGNKEAFLRGTLGGLNPTRHEKLNFILIVDPGGDQPGESSGRPDPSRKKRL